MKEYGMVALLGDETIKSLVHIKQIVIGCITGRKKEESEK